MKVLYVLSNKFPFGRAYASRVLNLCRMLRDLGHEVFVFCDYLSEEVERNQESCVVFDSISIYTTYSSLDGIHSLKRRVFGGKTANNSLNKILSENQFDLILSSSMSDRFSGVFHLAKRHHIPIVLEMCEWFDTYSWTYGKFDPRYWQYQRCWKNYYPRTDGVIAISRLLESFFERKGLHVIRIPTILDTSLMNYRLKAENDAIRLVFAGDISTGKDRLLEVIQALNGKNYARPVTLDIYGPSVKDIVNQSNGIFSEEMLKELKNVRIHGFCPQVEINNKCKESDFGLILRPKRRSSNAGFPTKLAEYFAAGTPVIANDTGDITLHLKSRYNGFVLKDYQPDTIEGLLRDVTLLSVEELSAMRKNARETAEKDFDYRVYKNCMSRFLLEVATTNQSTNR